MHRRITRRSVRKFEPQIFEYECPAFLSVHVLESLVQDADALDAVPRLLLRLELEAHLDLLILLPLVGELVRNDRVLVVRHEDAVDFLAALLRLDLELLVEAGVVFAELRDTEVERDDLGGGLAACDLDQVVHEEAGLYRLQWLAEANSRELRDYDRRLRRVGRVVPVDGILRLRLGWLLLRLGLLLYRLLEMA